jgi:hypothetical protein
VFLDLDRRHRAGMGRKSTLEYVLRTAASVIWTATRSGGFVQVTGMGEKAFHVPPGRGENHLTFALYELIRAGLDGTTPLSEVVLQNLPMVPASSTVVLISGTVFLDLAATGPLLEALRSRGTRVAMFLVNNFSFPAISGWPPPRAEVVEKSREVTFFLRSARRAGPGPRGVGRSGRRAGRRVDAMRRQPTDFLRARLTALFLLSLGAVSGSILAWWPQRATSPLSMLWPPLVIGAAAFGGAALYERLAAIDRVLRERVRAVAGVAYGTALLLMSLAMLLGHRKESEKCVAVLQALQVAFLLLAGFGRGYLGTLINALVLTAASMLAGGAGAALSATLLGGLLAFFLAADHASRKLTEYPVESLRGRDRSSRGCGPGAADFGSAGGLVPGGPPAPYAPLRPSTGGVTIPPERIAGLLRQRALRRGGVGDRVLRGAALGRRVSERRGGADWSSCGSRRGVARSRCRARRRRTRPRPTSRGACGS